MELASAQATQGADECSMRHGSVEDQIDSTDSMDSFASAARTESRSSSPGTGVDISRLSPLPSPGALPGSSQSSSLESGDPYPFPSARPEGWKKESSFDEGNARHQAVLRILCQLVVDQGASDTLWSQSSQGLCWTAKKNRATLHRPGSGWSAAAPAWQRQKGLNGHASAPTATATLWAAATIERPVRSTRCVRR
jgi:hypothetical protein